MAHLFNPGPLRGQLPFFQIRLEKVCEKMLISAHALSLISGVFSTSKLNVLLKNRRKPPLKQIRLLLENGVEPSPLSLNLALNTNEDVLDLVLTFWLTIKGKQIPDCMHENSNHLVILSDECRKKIEASRSRVNA